VYGTFETCRPTLKMSVYRGRPEVIGAQSNRRDCPKATSLSANRSVSVERPKVPLRRSASVSPYEEAKDKQNRAILSTCAKCGRRRCQWPRRIRPTFTSG
jgi:hypothetical protein